jgi:hypothetical protein
MGDENPHSIGHTRGLALSDSEKAVVLADSLEAQFQPVNHPSVPPVIQVVKEAKRAYSFAPASQPKLSNPMEMLSGSQSRQGTKPRR